MSTNAEGDREGMVKEGVMRPGRTPSVQSGRPSEEIRMDKQAYRHNETAVENLDDLQHLITDP